MAPFVSILHQMQNEGIKRRVTFFFGGNQVRDMFGMDRMKQFEKELDNFTFVPVVAAPADDEEWSGQKGLVTQAVQREMSDLSDLGDHEGYLCGSPGMIDAAVKVLQSMGMPDQRIFFDKFE